MNLKNYLRILEQHKVDNKILIQLNDKITKAKAEFASIGREWTALQAKVGEANVPKDIMDKYKAAGNKFNSAKKQLKDYIRTGIDPSKYKEYTRQHNPFTGSYRNWTAEEMRNAQKAANEIYAKSVRTNMIIWAIYLAATVAFAVYANTGKRVCNKLFGIQKTRCLLNFEINALIKKIESLQKNIYKCTKAKNPQRCKREIIAKIKTTQEKIKEQQEKLNNLGKRKKP